MAVTAIPLPLHVIGAQRQRSPAARVVRAGAPAPTTSAAAPASAAQTTTTVAQATTTASSSTNTQTTTSQAPATATQTTTSQAPATATQTTTSQAPATATQTTTTTSRTSTTVAPAPVATPPSGSRRLRHAAGWSKPAAKTARPHDLVLSVHRGSHSAHAAGDPGDTISDFKFSPATITIHVGDTITWTNNGPTAHTATANDHSFDTGTLQKGQSGSHTFTQAGAFPYICTIHPFMHGTVVVLASTTSTTPSQTGSGSSGSSGSGSTGSTGTSSTSTATAAPTTTATGPALPVTGLSLAAIVFAAAILIGSGAVLRRRSRA